METSIAKTSSSKSLILASTVKLDLLGKIFCQKYFDCCQVPRPSATVSGDFLSLYSYTAAHWRPARLPSSGAPATINQSRLRIVLFQPITGHVYLLQKNSLLDPGKNIPYLKPQDIMNSEKLLSVNIWQENSSALWRLHLISLQSAKTTLSLSQ